MMLSKTAKIILLLAIGSSVVAAALAQAAAGQAPRKILFVGDSFTYYQNGIYTHLERLAAAATPPLVVTADKSVFGGASLLSRIRGQVRCGGSKEPRSPGIVHGVGLPAARLDFDG